MIVHSNASELHQPSLPVGTFSGCSTGRKMHPVVSGLDIAGQLTQWCQVSNIEVEFGVVERHIACEALQVGYGSSPKRPGAVQIKDLNSGTFGFVELALDKLTGQQVAIKFIERGEKARTASPVDVDVETPLTARQPFREDTGLKRSSHHCR